MINDIRDLARIAAARMDLYEEPTLYRHGCTVSAYQNERGALEEVRRLQPAVNIPDILLTYQDGWELLTLLQLSKDLRHIENGRLL